MADQSLAFRVARLADVEPVHALVERGYRGEASREGWTTEADLVDGQRTDEAELRALIESDEHVIVLAEQSGELVGTCHLHARPDHTYFGMFTVRPDRQGAGIGGALIAEAERFAAQQWHAKKMRLVVIGQRQEVIAWYERRGYERTGEREPFPYESAHIIAKRDDLYMVVLERSLEHGPGPQVS